MGKKEPVCNWKSITRVATVVGQEMKGKQQKWYESYILQKWPYHSVKRETKSIKIKFN